MSILISHSSVADMDSNNEKFYTFTKSDIPKPFKMHITTNKKINFNNKIDFILFYLNLFQRIYL